MKENETTTMTKSIEKAYLGPLSLNKSKNNNIGKKRYGMSDDFSDLLTIRGIDSNKLDNFLSGCTICNNAESFYVLKNNLGKYFLSFTDDDGINWVDVKDSAKHYDNKESCMSDRKKLVKNIKNKAIEDAEYEIMKLSTLKTKISAGSYKLNSNQEREWNEILKDAKNNIDAKKKSEAIMNLWNRYNHVVTWCKSDLKKLTEGHKTVLESSILDDYEDESFETFLHALNIIDIPRLAHMKGSWTFWYTLKAYLIARNKSIITQHLKKITNECGEWTKSEEGEDLSIFETDLGKTSSPEEDYFKNQQLIVIREAIPKAYKKFNATQKTIWNLKKNGVRKADISNDIGVTINDVNKNLKAMKLMVAREIKTTSFKYNISVEW